MLLIGSKIPPFSAPAIKEDKLITISDNELLGHYTLLFFYALDFSYVCPTELYSLQMNLEEFNRRKTQVIAISVDSIYSHTKWLQTPRKNRGIEGTTIALISDMSQKLSKAFDVLDEENGYSLRASFIVDEANIIQYGSANSVAFGRSTKELLRIIDAIQSVQTGQAPFCAANWRMGIKKNNA